MTNHTVRLYVAASSIVAFFVLWAAIAAHPWRSQAADPRLAALARRESVLRRDAVLVRRIVSARGAAAADAKRAARTQALAAAQARRRAAVTPLPSVRIVQLPPLVVSRTS